MFQFLFLVRCCFRVGLLLTVLLLIHGTMPIWSQSNASNLSDSQDTLQTWNELYNQGQRIYEQQNNTLANLNREISTLRTGFAALTNLSGQLSQSNEDLKIFNEQIGQRMQEHDEDLAWAYEELDAKDLIIAGKNTVIWKLIVAVIGMGVIILGAVVFATIKFFKKK